MSEFKQKHKEYLKANDIKDEYELASYLEILKSDATKLSQNERQMMFDLIWLMVNEKSSLSSFFYAENNTNSTRHKSRSGETHTPIITFKTTIDQINDLYAKGIVKYTNSKCNNTFGCFCDGSCKKEQKLPIEIPKPTPFNKSDKDDVITNSSRGEKETMGYLQGVKENQQKPKAPIFTYCKVNKHALEALSLRALYGHEKYKKFDEDWQNFSRVPNGYFEYSNSLFRHALEIGGEETEEEHLIASAWNAIARLEIYLRNKK